MSLPPMKPDFPHAPVSVTVVFRGLLTFCFNGTTSCEVGVLNDFPVGQEHELVFRKWKKSAINPPDPELSFTRPTSSFELRVTNPLPSLNGVFMIGRNPFNRTGTNNLPQDLRWMIDFESDIYTTPVPKLPAKVRPRLSINKGVFYAHHTTQTKLNAHASSGATVKPLGSVAEVVAARIFLDTGGFVEVFVDNTLVDTLNQAVGVEYQIDVFNLCDPSTHADCRFVPGHPTDKTRRNDFYIYYNAFDMTAGLEEFQLIPVLPSGESTITGICRRAGEAGTDPAPCGPGGFGGSSTFG